MTRLPTWVRDRIVVSDLDDLRLRLAAGSPADAAWVPVGTGAHLGRGSAPTRPCVALDLRNLNRILDHAADDLTITVEAGCTLDHVTRKLEEADQWVPGMPRGAGTVGGWIGADVRGCLSGGLGSVRDALLRVVLLDGRNRRVEAGAKVVKSVAGYDLMKLCTGSLGSLGVVVEVTFRVLPRPQQRGGVRGFRPSATRQQECLDHIIHTWQPEAVLAEEGEVPRWTVVVSGPSSRVEAATADVARLLDDAEVLDPIATENLLTTLDVQNTAGDAWLGWGGALPGDLAGLDLALDPGERLTADLLRGQVWLRFGDMPAPDRLATIRESLARAEGVLHLDAPTGEETASPWGSAGGGEAALFAGIQERFDPHGMWPVGRLPGSPA